MTILRICLGLTIVANAAVVAVSAWQLILRRQDRRYEAESGRCSKCGAFLHYPGWTKLGGWKKEGE